MRKIKPRKPDLWAKIERRDILVIKLIFDNWEVWLRRHSTARTSFQTKSKQSEMVSNSPLRSQTNTRWVTLTASTVSHYLLSDSSLEPWQLAHCSNPSLPGTDTWPDDGNECFPSTSLSLLQPEPLQPLGWGQGTQWGEMLPHCSLTRTRENQASLRPAPICTYTVMHLKHTDSWKTRFILEKQKRANVWRKTFLASLISEENMKGFVFIY